MLNISQGVCFCSIKFEDGSSTTLETSKLLDENHILPLNVLDNPNNVEMYQFVADEFLKTKKRFNRLQEETDRLHHIVKRALQEKFPRSKDTQSGFLRQSSSTHPVHLSSVQSSFEWIRKSDTQQFPLQEQILTLTFAFIGFHASTVYLFSSTKRAWFLLKQAFRFNICRRQPLILETKSKNRTTHAFYGYPVCCERSLAYRSPVFSWKHSFQYSCLLCSLYFTLQGKQLFDGRKSLIISKQKQGLPKVPMAELLTEATNSVLTREHVTKFLSSLALHNDGSVEAFVSKLRSHDFTEMQQKYLEGLPYHPLNEALIFLFRESALEVELTRQQALAKGGLDGLRWQSLSKDMYLKDIYTSMLSKLYLTEDKSASVDSLGTSDKELIDNVILKECKSFADYLLAEIPFLLQEEKKKFCSQVTEEVLEKICKWEPATASSHT